MCAIRDGAADRYSEGEQREACTDAEESPFDEATARQTRTPTVERQDAGHDTEADRQHHQPEIARIKAEGVTHVVGSKDPHDAHNAGSDREVRQRPENGAVTPHESQTFD